MGRRCSPLTYPLDCRCILVCKHSCLQCWPAHQSWFMFSYKTRCKSATTISVQGRTDRPIISSSAVIGCSECGVTLFSVGSSGSSMSASRGGQGVSRCCDVGEPWFFLHREAPPPQASKNYGLGIAMSTDSADTTFVHLPWERMGERAAKKLLERPVVSRQPSLSHVSRSPSARCRMAPGADGDCASPTTRSETGR